MKPAYDAVFLDMGHTLLDYARPVHEVWAEALRAVDGPAPEAIDAAFTATVLESPQVVPGKPVSVEENRAVWSENYRRILHAAGFAGDMERAVDLLWDAWFRTSWRPYPDVPGVLSALREHGYTLAVVSNWAPDLEETIGTLGLADYFAAVACSAVVGYEKPHPRIFETALEATGVSPDRVLHVGDNYECDVLGARSVGMDAVLLTRPGAPRFNVEEPPPTEPRLTSLEELLDLLGAPTRIV